VTQHCLDGPAHSYLWRGRPVPTLLCGLKGHKPEREGLQICHFEVKYISRVMPLFTVNREQPVCLCIDAACY
jgi:hypothetical protein